MCKSMQYIQELLEPSVITQTSITDFRKQAQNSERQTNKFSWVIPHVDTLINVFKNEIVKSPYAKSIDIRSGMWNEHGKHIETLQNAESACERLHQVFFDRLNDSNIQTKYNFYSNSSSNTGYTCKITAIFT